MINQIDPIDFNNSVNCILEEFVNGKMEEIHNILVYSVFDRQDVLNIFQEGMAAPRPTFRFFRESPQLSAKTNISQTSEGQSIYLSYTIFCIVNEELSENIKPSILIDRMCAYFKNIFDSHIKSNLYGFYDVKCGYPSDKLAKVADNTYTKSFDLSFRIIKEII